ncbi:HD domain-containing protein [Numidum massiliense]|uniref:HD domain-containing protein n=1 Tax=Numidum massiliense TaxID=1522315 RepID=UPI0006D52D08|nr:HD domain-containing protein [Numidum massiliense]
MVDEPQKPQKLQKLQKQYDVLLKARDYVKSELSGDHSGHDWWHIDRVTNLAKEIARAEQADAYVCELAALLHDIADEKLNESHESGMRKVRDWLDGHRVEQATAAHVLEIIATMSYSGGHNPPMRTLEGRVVQDADRLDALGAVGIARTFAYAGWKGQLIHDPARRPREQLTKQEYRQQQTTAINHFYEKLLKLEGLMNTDTAKRLARDRHQFMETFLEQFYREWGGGHDECR